MLADIEVQGKDYAVNMGVSRLYMPICIVRALFCYRIRSIGYIYSHFKKALKELSRSSKIFPGHGDTFYFRSNFLVVTIIGSVIGFIFFSPTNLLEALAAGF